MNKENYKIEKRFLKYFSRSRVFVLVLISFIVGIFISSLVFGIERPAEIFARWYLIIIIFTAIAAVLIIYWQEIIFRLVILAVLGILIGIFYYLLFLPKIDEAQIAFYNGKEVEVQGYISQEPDRRDNSTKYELKINKLRMSAKGRSASGGENNEREVSGNVLVSTARFPEYQFGEVLKVKGKLETPPKFEDFDYASYLAKADIYSIIKKSEVQKISEPQKENFSFMGWQWFKIKRAVLKIKNHFEETLNKILPEPLSSLLSGILIGSRRSIPADLLLIFNIIGLTHIIAISGYNITIIIKYLGGLLRYLPKILEFCLLLLAIILFIVLTGASASVIRAGLMATLILLAPLIGRRSDITIALLFTAVLMLLFNPKILRYDVGFQLSFLAVAGLIYLSPILGKMIENWRYRRYIFKPIRGYFCETISAQIMVVPIVFFNFSRLSLIAPLANVLILPFVPLTMGIGFVAGILGMIWLRLGEVIGYLLWLLLKYMVIVSDGLSRIPLASITKTNISWVIIPLYYLIGMAIYLKLKKKINKDGTATNPFH